MNILLWLAYKGTNYSGFQVQPNGVTVCAVVQDAMQSVFGTRPDVKGCSRTDAGVHARRFALNFHYDGRIPVQRIPLALTPACPWMCGHWQRSRCRMISTPAMPPTPKPTTTACGAARWMIPLIMRPATGSTARWTLPPCRRRLPIFVGRHDFLALCASGSSAAAHGDTVRTITACTVQQDGELYTLSVTADGYLYNMVRILAGTVLQAGLGKMNPAAVPALLQSRNRGQAGPTLPARGLFLWDVQYPDLERPND